MVSGVAYPFTPGSGNPTCPVEGLTPCISSHMDLDVQKESEISHITLPFSFSLGCKGCFKVMVIKGNSEINLLLIRESYSLTILFKRLGCGAELNKYPPCTPPRHRYTGPADT